MKEAFESKAQHPRKAMSLFLKAGKGTVSSYGRSASSHRRNCIMNRPFPSSPQSLFQSEVKCEIFVMVISSNFNMNEN